MKLLDHAKKSIFELISPSASLTLTGYFFVFMLAVLVVGCGAGDINNDNDIDIESDIESESGSGGEEITPGVDTASVVARTGPIIAVRVGETSILDGSRSSAALSIPLSFSWSFSHKPETSNTELQGATTENPSFIADVKGVYIVPLVVSANGISSQRAIQTVVVTLDGERLTGPFNHPGLSSECVNCHNGLLVDPGKSPNHIATSNMCQACHTPQGAAIIPFADHLEVFGDCSECHNGVSAIGKSEFHTPTNAECDDCHNTTSFLELAADGSFDHSNISRSCTGCHNGTVAKGKDEGHVVTNTECGYCHTTVSFLPAYLDHTGPDVVGNRCDSCHDGDIAAGQPNGHPVMNVDCEICHSIVTFSLDGVFDHSLLDPTVQPCESCHNDNNSINAPGKSSAVPGHPDVTGDCGLCHNTETFAGAFTDHTGIVENCESCHDGDTASGKSSNHMPTTEDCSVCHSIGTFTSGTFSHGPAYIDPPALCADCHNNVITVGKLINHLPGNGDCSDCHLTTSFIPATFDHAGIVDNCVSCHDGNISTGKPLNHLPTILDCSDCHTAANTSNFTSFAGISFNHLGIDQNNCASCHDTGIATPKTVNHIPAQDDCSVCHDSTDVFTSTTFLTNVHPGFARGCEGCHVSQFLPTATNPGGNLNVVKSASHLPTDQDCYLCHTIDAFIPSIFAHTGITGNCVSCHDGSLNNVAAGAIGATDTAIHSNTSGDCAVCHNTTNFLDAFVDHNGPDVVGNRCDSCHNGIDATGKDARTDPPHVATNEDCKICHVAGGSFVPAVFDHADIVDNCASCHDGVAAIGKSQTHLPTTQDCSVCHNTTAFAGARFDHLGIVDNCVSCHDGLTASGKSPPPDHVPTNDDCSNCHQTTGFIPATFDHVGIVDNCASCHDAGFATGKSDAHIITNEDCGLCHNTSTFTGAVFDHTGIVDNCESCHDGVTAIGKDARTNPAHLATVLDCHFCHTTATFLGGTWVHDASSTGRCDECHNDTGGGATSKPADHLNTTVQCDVCHSTNGWAPDIFSHDPQGDYPGDHGIDPGCSVCHGSSINPTFVYPSPTYAPFCAACHESDFEPKGDHIGGESGTVEQNKNCASSGCHQVSDSEF